MIRLPRYDLQRAEVDTLHAQCLARFSDFEKAHAQFSKRVNLGFSPLTECAAIAYANATYHADIARISMHFTVEPCGLHYDVILIVAEKGATFASKKLTQHSYSCQDKALETCRVLNALFQLSNEGEVTCHSLA